MRRKRDSEVVSDEENLKLKKTLITKKPTQLIKQKPTSPLPLKSSTISSSYAPLQGDHSSFSPSSGDVHSMSSFQSASATTDGTSFFAPEDVTLPPNSTTDVSITFISDVT